MKETKGSIAVKLGIIFAFLVLIIGGGSLVVSGLSEKNYWLFGVGIFVLMLGLFTCAVLAQWVAYYDAKNGNPKSDKTFAKLTFKNSLKGGVLFAFLSSFMVFTGICIHFWTEYGYWHIGVLGIMSIIVMVIIAVIISVNYQTAASKKVFEDPKAVEFTGIIESKLPGLSIFIFNKAIIFFWEYRVNIGSDIQSVTYLRRTNKLSKRLYEGNKVKIKMNPNDTNYCAIIDKLK